MPPREQCQNRRAEVGPLAAGMRSFDFADERRVPPNDGVVGKASRGAALAVMPPGSLVRGVQPILIFRSSFGASDARDATGGLRPGRPHDQEAAVGWMLPRAAG